MLHHGPHYGSALSALSGADDEVTGALSLFLPGEVNVAELALTCAPTVSHRAHALLSLEPEGGGGLDSAPTGTA